MRICFITTELIENYSFRKQWKRNLIKSQVIPACLLISTNYMLCSFLPYSLHWFSILVLICLLVSLETGSHYVDYAGLETLLFMFQIRKGLHKRHVIRWRRNRRCSTFFPCPQCIQNRFTMTEPRDPCVPTVFLFPALWK